MIARLAEALSYHHGSEVVESLDDETAAETLEEMPAERQARILGDMDQERAAEEQRAALHAKTMPWRSSIRKESSAASGATSLRCSPARSLPLPSLPICISYWA